MNPIKSRRQFLQLSSALMFGAATSAATLSNAQTNAAGTFNEGVANEEYWQQVRGQFAFSENIVPMNAANLCPSFRTVSEEVALLTYDIDVDCSFSNRAKFNDLREQSRDLVAKQLKVNLEEIAMVRNTSEANNIVNNGLKLNSGDEILIWDQNHPTNNVAWEVRAARFGLSVKKVSTPVSPTNVTQLIETFTSQFSPRTKVLALTHVSNLSGIQLPVAEIIEAAHQQDIYVHVDGAQVWGAMDLDLKAMGADSFTASAHKWYMGPKEVGLLYVKEANIDRIWASGIAPGWGNSVETNLTGARKFESLGQRDDSALAALGVAARLHDEIGTERIEQRVRHLAQMLKEGIVDLGLEMVTPMDPSLSFGVCITQVQSGQGRAVSNRLYTEHGINGAATGGLRLCPTIYNTEEHIERAIAGVKALLT